MRSSGSNPIQTKKTKNKHKDAKKTKRHMMSVRLLSGRLQQLSVKPDTTILSIKADLENRLNPPEFHKVSLYVGDTELSEGSISEVALAEDTEVHAVMQACTEKPVKLIEELIECL